MTRDTTGSPADEEPWTSGLTGPQRAFPVWEGEPGYEFEGRRTPAPPPVPAARRSRGAAARPAAAHPAAAQPDAGPRRFRFTQTVSQPMPVPPSWEEPGFEFDARARTAASFEPPARPGPALRPQRRPHPPAEPGARTEWTRLLRSFLPEPVRRNWFAEFRSALHFRGAGTRVIIPIVAMMVFGVAVAVFAGANNSHAGPPPPPEALGYPPASLAGHAFAAAASGRGISQTLGRVASDGAQIVAVGAQRGARISRAQFFVSADNGRTWSMGHVQAPGGGPPPPGYAAEFVAGGRGAWVALGPRAIWTSPDGRTWTLASTTGLPLRRGDQVNVLTRTAAGFLAAGSNGPDASPVLFLSANGTTWRRLGAGQLTLPLNAKASVRDIKYAAARGRQILIAGDVTATQAAGQRPATAQRTATAQRPATIQTSAAWLSGNGGTTWTLAVPPGPPAGRGNHGAQAQINGLAVTAGGFVLLRPATAARSPAVDAYRSADGTTWTFQATLATPAGFAAGLVNGSQGSGAVVTGQAGKTLVAFTSVNGAAWRRTAPFGSAAAQDVSGAVTTEDGTVVTAGTTTDDPDSRQPLLTVLGAQARRVNTSAIPGATDQELAVNDVAAGHGTQVAVGSANGYPAAWLSSNGGSTWTRAAGQTPAVLERPGVQQLTSVAYGAQGWLAVGGVIAVVPQHPVVLVSGNGSTWAAADGEAAFTQPGLVTEQAAASPKGYVIVGYQAAGGRTVAAAWWSANLTSWQRGAVPAANAASAGPAAGAASGATTASGQMLAVTAGPGGFVAVGSDGTAAAAWTSADGGRTWTAKNVPLPVGATRAVLQHVAGNGRMVVAVGTALTTAGQQLPFAASSADGGTTWTESALPVPSGRAFVTALTADGASGFLATGTYGSTPGHQDVVVWTSATGAAWKAATPGGQGLAGTGIQAITGLTVSGPMLSGVGFTATPGGEQPVLWTSPIR